MEYMGRDTFCLTFSLFFCPQLDLRHLFHSFPNVSWSGHAHMHLITSKCFIFKFRWTHKRQFLKSKMFTAWRTCCVLYFISLYASFFFPCLWNIPCVYIPFQKIQLLKTIIVHVRHKETDQVVCFSNLDSFPIESTEIKDVTYAKWWVEMLQKSKN